jgi:SAM-dependent methyltransferase
MMNTSVQTSDCKNGRGAVLSEFTQWCREELFTPNMVQAAALLERACDLHLSGLYRSLHLDRHLSSPKNASELTSELGFVESASIALEAMLLRLADRTTLVEADCTIHPPRFTGTQQGADTSQDLEHIRAAMRSLGESYMAAIDFLDFGAEHYVHGLRDDPDFMDRVLSGREPKYADLWYRATNEDPLQDAHGIMGAKLIEMLFHGGRILEIGGGTGNGTRHLLSRLSRDGKLSFVQNYTFTDVSLNFIMSTRQAIIKSFPSVKTDWKYLDINKAFAAQKVAPDSVDLIYGVNSAHVATEMVPFLEECRRSLRPNGMVVFAERVLLKGIQMAPRELALDLSIWHRTAAVIHADHRPVHCYLPPKAWRRVLEMAGFSDVQIYPDLDRLSTEFPDQYAAVIVGYK